MIDGPHKDSDQGGMNTVEVKISDNLYGPLERLCQRLTGLSLEEKPEDVFGFLTQAQLKVREKYGLPASDGSYAKDPQGHYQDLVRLAPEKGLKVAYVKPEAFEKLDYDLSGRKMPRAGFTPPDKLVLPEIDLETAQAGEVYLACVEFEHELIHFLQEMGGEELAPEENEFEAYAGANWRYIVGAAAEDGGNYLMKVVSATTDFFVSVRDSALDQYEYELGIPEKQVWFMRAENEQKVGSDGNN